METSAEMTQRHWRERQELESRERAEARVRMQAERDAKDRAEAETRVREHETKLENEVANTDVNAMLDAIARAGVELKIVGSSIEASPTGKLSPVQRRVITERRDEVVARLEQRSRAETL